MLKAIPKSWLSWDFRFEEDSSVVAEIDVSHWREKAELTVVGSTYKLFREGWMSGAFVLEADGAILARAEKPSALYRRFVVEHEGRRSTLEAAAAFRRKFVLSEGGAKIGSVSPDGLFTRRATADLPDDLPLPVKVFVVWLVLILWRRAANSASAAGAGH